MKKLFLIFGLVTFAAAMVFAQSDEDLFSTSDEDYFGTTYDEFFAEDGIEDLLLIQDDVSADTDLKKGILFENGSVKIGGSFSTSIGTSTTLFDDGICNYGASKKDEDDEPNEFVYHLSHSELTPTASAYITVDARPTQDLRMYTKFGLAYPFSVTAASVAKTKAQTLTLTNPQVLYYTTDVTTTVSDWFSLKEMFTDFSIKDTAFFRFGLHTVTLGTGYFFSPVSDMINTTSIDPEDVDKGVAGSLNLRTQITFPNTQNCLWFYVIPSTEFIKDNTVISYTKNTGFAAKGDIVFGGWELGVGGYWRWEDSPKAMLTATGSVKNINIFAEGVYLYGGASEWKEDSSYKDKTSIFQATVGASYFWKNPSITLAGQYYFDGNKVDKLIDAKYDFTPTSKITVVVPRVTQGHNIAVMANFGRIFGTTDVTASLFGLVNFGREEIDAQTKSFLTLMGMNLFNTGTFSAMLNYAPISALKISVGPYVTFEKFDESPVVSLKVNFTLGGGRF